MKRFFASFAPPYYKEPEKYRQAELLNGVSLVLFVILSFLLIINLFHDTGLGSAVNPVLLSLIVSQVIAQVMIRSGYVRQAGISLLFLSWLGITWFALLADGVHDVVLFAYVTILLGAGYMFGWWAVLVTGVGSIFAVWLLAIFEIQGFSQPTLADPSRVALYLTALFVLISFQVYYVINTLKRSLAELTREVQARQQVEDRLREEHERLNFALNAAKMGTWSWNVETEIVEWSDQIEPLFGMEKGCFDGKYSTYLSIIYPEDLPQVENAIRRTLVDPDSTYTIEHRILLPDGRIRWLEGRGNVYRNDAGQPVRMAGTVVDITDRKDAESALRRAEENYKTIVENSLQGIFQSTPDGRYLSINKALARIYGYETSEEFLISVQSIPDQIYLDPADRVKFSRAMEEEGVTSGFEVRNRRKDGTSIWISCNARAVKDASGKIIYYEGTIEDITLRKELDFERERLLRELGAKNAELERFVYTVSHDLKSPLVTIVGFLGYLEDDFKTGNEKALQKDMERIYRAAFKMKDLLQDLLDLSRVGRMMNEPRAIPFNVLLNEALELTEGRLRERGVQIHIQPDLPSIHGDPQRLLEVVQNLIDNAAKYMGDQLEPSIEIGCNGVENGYPVFYVRDNGMGIDPEHHERIFGLFNKLDPNVEGTGVGLALVKRIVEFHGGRIWVESQIGQGATFWFTLPLGNRSASEDGQETH